MSGTALETPDRFKLWRLVLLIGFGLQVALGYSVVFGYRTALWSIHRTGMAEALWGLPDLPEIAVPIVDQLCAMLGATLSCWAVAMLFVVHGPFARREPWAWWCVLASTLAWGVVDTAMSVYHGVTINVLFNMMPLVMICVPLAATWRAFHPGGQTS